MKHEKALVNVGGGRQTVMQDHCNSDHCVVDDPNHVRLLHQQILFKLQGRPHPLWPLMNWKRQATCRWIEQMPSHTEIRIWRAFWASFRWKSPASVGSRLGCHGEESEIPVLPCLNEGCQGDNTRFLTAQDNNGVHWHWTGEN